MSRNLFEKPPGTGKETPVVTVSQLSCLIRDLLKDVFPDLLLVGEISRVTYHRSGHIYLTLKDEKAVIDGVIWRSTAARLRFKLEAGMEVLCTGGVEAYPPRGTYQFIVRKIEPRGDGTLQMLFRQLVERLRKEGLFDEEGKRPLPRFPERIGIVTSPTGAAIRDMIRVITRRYPLASLLLVPVRVQGEEAPEEIAKAIRFFNERLSKTDVLIIGRGGGSLEDLWAFNDEQVARTIAASEIPIVSAVGHESDITIADLVADRRAATPSEAAELVVPSREELLKLLRGHGNRMSVLLSRTVTMARQRLDGVGRSYCLRRPEALFEQVRGRLDETFLALNAAIRERLRSEEERVKSLAAQAEALSPLKVLSRGYSVTTTAEGAVIRRADEVAPEAVIHSRLGTGSVRSRVISTDPEDRLRMEPDGE